MDKHKQHYTKPSLPKHLENKAPIYSTENEKKHEQFGSYRQNPHILSKTHMQRQNLCSLLATEWALRATTYDNKNPLWLRSCLGSLKPFEVVGHQLSPLSTPPLLKELKESWFFCNWCVSLEDHFSNLYWKRRANRMCFTHWEEWGMSWEELEMSCCSIPHGDIQVRETFCLTRTLKCQLPSPPSCLCIDCTRGSGWEVCLCK